LRVSALKSAEYTVQHRISCTAVCNQEELGSLLFLTADLLKRFAAKQNTVVSMINLMQACMYMEKFFIDKGKLSIS